MPKPESSSQNGLFSRSQKREILALSGLSLIVLIFGILQIRHNIRAPFDSKLLAKNNDSNSSLNSLLSSETATSSTGFVRDQDGTLVKDTDHDGLSDDDENNVYKTSPYLPDSDGDGFSDSEEVRNGTDPLCPAGKSCTVDTSLGQGNSQLTTSSETIDFSIDTSGATAATTTLSNSNSEDILQSVLAGNSDPAVLRKLLIDNGMDKKQLDQISDEDLVRSYQETLSQHQADASASSTAVNTAATTTTTASTTKKTNK